MNSARGAKRENAKAAAEQLIARGKHNEAAEVLKRATEVTWDVVQEMIQVNGMSTRCT